MDPQEESASGPQGERASLRQARQSLVEAVATTKAKVHDATGLELNRTWIAPVVAGAAGLALALWLRRSRK